MLIQQRHRKPIFLECLEYVDKPGFVLHPIFHDECGYDRLFTYFFRTSQRDQQVHGVSCDMFIHDGGLQHTQSELVDGVLRQVRRTIPDVHQFRDHLGVNALGVL